MRFGLALQNLIPPSLGKNNFPMNLRFGTAVEGFRKKLIYSLDVNLENFTGNAGKSTPVRWHTGAEYSITKILFLRAGVDYKEMSFGVGFVSKNFRIDYGVAVHPLDTTHRVGLTGRFGIPLTEEELRVQEERKKLELSKEAYARMMDALKFYREKNFAQAKSSLGRVLEVEPENNQAKLLLAEVNLTLGKEESTSALDGARDAYNKMQYEDSVTKAKKVLDYDPENKEAAIIYHLSQAQISIDDEKYENARKELITVLKLDVTNQDAKIMLKRVEETLKFLK
jgi:tetratricopeptide (TPR) repeat protein